MFDIREYKNGYMISGCKSDYSDIRIPKKIKGKPVIAIGPGAFKDSDIRTVSLPNTIEQILPGAFENCTNLFSVKFPPVLEGVYRDAFKGCSSLMELNLVKCGQIGAYAFYGCNSLRCVKGEISTVDDYSFSDCYKLESIDCKLKGIGDYAFSSCVSLTNIPVDRHTIYIGSYAFLNCISLYSIDLFGAYLGEGVFKGCTHLHDVEFRPNFNDVPDRAFEGCSNLRAANLPLCVYRIGKYAFKGCTSLVEVMLPTFVRLSPYAFEDTSSLESVVIGSGTFTIPEGCFKGSGLLKFELVGLNKFIESYAFACCNRLKKVAIDVRGMGEGVFQNCTNLEEAGVFGVTMYLGAFTFANCMSLNHIKLSPRINVIRDYAFAGVCPGCKIEGLRKVYHVSQNVFNSVSIIDMKYKESLFF